MPAWFSRFFLLLFLWPSIHGAIESWEHSHHDHAMACQEEGVHFHALEGHCDISACIFLGCEWDFSQPEIQSVFENKTPVATTYLASYFDPHFGMISARGPPLMGTLAIV
ncbi:MAG: hypothetical protein P8N56_01390 [Schleiferiaceae bacterium]|nr:hypothetical protein [Schleiferiaceae bacterium]